MYESTINIEIIKDGSIKPLNFLHTLDETTTLTGVVSGTINLHSVWINNTLENKVISTVEVSGETKELVEAWANVMQAQATSIELVISIDGV